MQLPNIYLSKNVRFFIAVPLVLMAIGLYFSTHIVLDSSLAGGLTITLQSNTTMTSQQISSAVASALKTQVSSVTKSGQTVTMVTAYNQSLYNAYNYLLSFERNQSLYNGYLSNATNATFGLQTSPNNKTLESYLASANAGINLTLGNMRSSLAAELSALSPFMAAPEYNDSNVTQMALVAQNANNNVTTSLYPQKVISQLHSALPFATTPSVVPTPPSQGKAFFSSLITIIIAAFILVSIVVFIIFRSVAPSFAVIFGAANDMIIALGAMGILGIPLGIASIGGLLMLLGYSIDTDVLTSIRIIKRHEGTPEERAYSSMKTGLTMTGAAVASFAVLFIISIFAYIPTYYEISGVVLFGLLGDIATTWLGNASLVLLYQKRRERLHGHS